MFIYIKNVNIKVKYTYTNTIIYVCIVMPIQIIQISDMSGVKVWSRTIAPINLVQSVTSNLYGYWWFILQNICFHLLLNLSCLVLVWDHEILDSTSNDRSTKNDNYASHVINTHLTSGWTWLWCRTCVHWGKVCHRYMMRMMMNKKLVQIS